jgi:hypothetical protein
MGCPCRAMMATGEHQKLSVTLDSQGQTTTHQ